MKPRRPSALTSPAPCGAFLCPSASPCNVPAFAPPLPRAGGLPSALPLSPFGPVPPRLVKPRRPAAAASLCPISQSPAAGRLCRPLTVPPLASPAPAVRPAWGGTVNPFAGPLPAPCRPGRAATVAAGRREAWPDGRTAGRSPPDGRRRSPDGRKWEGVTES